MKKNYTVMFIMMFVASIAGGLALQNVFEYAMVVGFGLGIVFLLCSAYLAGKNKKDSKSQ
ncbi:hypothetical protein [Terrihalobacillus insolitus]|uniref:hypothetical protein n=1 Tax=Terrihalobacillus insolitus TaxID=2950438 RepID=UPI002340F1CE|nr:hypothetical protein [Terrihalobacillus insolitus]MDC3414755.1 hypothetical protein [Terrihalobacillus insolitus]